MSDAKAATGGLRRNVGLTSLMFISLGSIIGSGWLLGALTAAKAAGGASLVSWVLAGVIIILLALVHAELGSAYPLAGGTARFPRLAFGSIAGFTAGWVAWLQAVTIAPIEVEAALSYLDHIWPGMVDENGALVGKGLVIAVVLMLIFTLINVAGVNWLAESNKATVIWKTAVPVLTIIVLIAVCVPRQQLHRGRRVRPVRRARDIRGAPTGRRVRVAGLRTGRPDGRRGEEPAAGHAARGHRRGAHRHADLHRTRGGVHRRARLEQPDRRLGEPDRRRRLRPVRHDRHVARAGLARGHPLHRRVHLPGGHRPHLRRHVGAAVLRARARGLHPEGRQQDLLARCAVDVGDPRLRRGPDLLPAVPELAGPRRARHVGHGDHVRVRADHAGRAAQGRPGPAAALPAARGHVHLRAGLHRRQPDHLLDGLVHRLEAVGRRARRLRDLRRLVGVQAPRGEAAAGPDRARLDAAVVRRARGDLVARPVRRRTRHPAGVDRPAGGGGVQRRDLLPGRADGAAQGAGRGHVPSGGGRRRPADPVLAEG